jgi:hypothetical protein
VIDITLDNPTAVIAKMENTANDLMAEITRRLDYEAGAVADRIRANASGGIVQAQTGRLADSVLEGDVQQAGLTASVTITAAEGDAFYGKILERGTKAYPIGARFREAGTLSPKGRKLKARFGATAETRYMKIFTGGETIFRKLVEHPAIAKHPWFSSVLDEFTPRIVEGVAEGVGKALEE